MADDRYAAYSVLRSIEKNGEYSKIALKKAEDRGLDSPAFVRELVYGTLERKLYLDWMLDKVIERGTSSVRRDTLILLRMGLYQIEFMDSVPDFSAVDETVKLSRKCLHGQTGFVNGVLRGYLRKRGSIALPDEKAEPDKYLSVRYSCGMSLVRLLTAEFGHAGAEKMLAFSLEKPPVFIRINTAKTAADGAVGSAAGSTAGSSADGIADGAVESVRKELALCGIKTKPSRLSARCFETSGVRLTSSDAWKNGLFSIQSEESCFIADQLCASPGDTVIDVCAAPGQKSFAAAESMDDTGTVYAGDLYEQRVELIRKEAERIGLWSVKPYTWDAASVREDFLGTDGSGIADVVLADVPCSGIGVIRRKPEIKYKDFSSGGKTFGAIEELAGIQSCILETASKYVKPGGRLIYSTCTVTHAENADVAHGFAENHRTGSGERSFILTSERQLLPQTDGTDGFYVAVFTRIG